MAVDYLVGISNEDFLIRSSRSSPMAWKTLEKMANDFIEPTIVATDEPIRLFLRLLC
jgi:hypothetical protein